MDFAAKYGPNHLEIVALVAAGKVVLRAGTGNTEIAGDVFVGG